VGCPNSGIATIGIRVAYLQSGVYKGKDMPLLYAPINRAGILAERFARIQTCKHSGGKICVYTNRANVVAE